MRGDYEKHRKLSLDIVFFEAPTLEVLRRLLTAFFGKKSVGSFISIRM